LVIAALFLWLWEPWRDPPPPGGPNPETLEGIVEIAQAGPEVPGSLAAYWKTKLSSADPPIAVRRPRGFIPYQVDAFPETACFWDSSDRNNASYCSDDHKISWDADWFQELHRLFGSVAPLSVLAHEYGHHISYLLNDLKGAGPRYSKQDELQADCFAGMYLSSANKTLNLSNRQLVLEAFEIFKSADPQSDDPWFAAGRHGSGQERLKAMGNGFFLRSLQNCEQYQDYHGDLVAEVGPYPLAVTPGVKVDRIDENNLRLGTTTGQTVDVSFLSEEKGESPIAVLERFKSGLFASGSVDDVRLGSLGPPDQAEHHYGTQVTQRYGVSFVRDGQRQRFHGVVQVVVLDEGGAIAFNAVEPGPARGADPASWPELERVLTELQAGIWPEQQEGG
jgi:hypothetical protein